MCRCRTNALSLRTQNKYAYPLHKHCFGAAAVGAPPLPPPALVVGAAGRSCDDACAATQAGWVCDPRYFDAINACDVLRARFHGCPGGCFASDGYDRPSFVAKGRGGGGGGGFLGGLLPSSTPLQTGRCLVNADRTFFACAGSLPGMQRLCGCREEFAMGR